MIKIHILTTYPRAVTFSFNMILYKVPMKMFSRYRDERARERVGGVERARARAREKVGR